MIPYLFVGDLHGNMAAADLAITEAARHGATIIQVGDWGFLWGSSTRTVPDDPDIDPDDFGAQVAHRLASPRLIDQTDNLSALLVAAGVSMRYVDGNHDVHPLLRAYPPGDDNVAPNLTYQPRGSLYVDADGTRFVFLGGAVSIDKAARVPGRSWWPEEAVTAADVRAAERHGAAHVLVTHDAAVLPPGVSDVGVAVGHRLAAADNRAYIAEAIQALRPQVHVHGHWHRAYQTRAGRMTTIGLDRDGHAGLWRLWRRGDD